MSAETSSRWEGGAFFSADTLCSASLLNNDDSIVWQIKVCKTKL